MNRAEITTAWESVRHSLEAQMDRIPWLWRTLEAADHGTIIIHRITGTVRYIRRAHEATQEIDPRSENPGIR